MTADEFLVSDAGTIKRVDYSYIKAGNNTPAFHAYETTAIVELYQMILHCYTLSK